MAKLERTRSWPVRANALLLVLQAAGLGGIAAYTVWQVDWQQLVEQAETEASVSPGLQDAAEQAVIFVLVLGPPAVLALLAAIGLLFLFRIGWLLAMMVQALSLLACLLLYVEWTQISYREQPPDFIYLVMLYCIVMTLYLNSSDVRAAFQIKPRTRRATRGR